MRRLLITAFGLGSLPLAPGTWGSLGAVVLYLVAWCVLHHRPAGGAWLNAALAAAILAASIATVALGPWTEHAFGEKDPSACVSDELAGQWAALLFVPAGASTGPMLLTAATQFVLFRVLDVWKPPPARRIERLPHGWGVLLDDLVAGLYANLIGQALFRYLLSRGG